MVLAMVPAVQGLVVHQAAFDEGCILPFGVVATATRGGRTMRQTKAQLEEALKNAIDIKNQEYNHGLQLAGTVRGQAATIRSLQAEVATLRAEATERVQRHNREMEAVHKRASAPFKRNDFEHMTTEQLRSGAEEIINECRRKGMLEAEGLTARHKELLASTDLELMDTMAKNYAARALQLRREKEAREQAKPVIDSRPLIQRLDANTQAQLYQKTTNWWRGTPAKPPLSGTGALCWCGNLTIRGQCPEHTQKWAGDERCTCGRLFRFCKESATQGHWHKPVMAPRVSER